MSEEASKLLEEQSWARLNKMIARLSLEINTVDKNLYVSEKLEKEPELSLKVFNGIREGRWVVDLSLHLGVHKIKSVELYSRPKRGSVSYQAPN